MSRYFMRETPLSGLEKMMMTPPGYKPRGSGLRLPRKYTADGCDCKYCLIAEQRGCPCRTADQCVCFEERFLAGCWTHGELAVVLTGKVGMPALTERTRRVLPQRTASPFKDQTHRQRMISITAAMKREPSPYTAAIFLLSADTTLWRKAYPTLQENGVDFERIDVRGVGADGYALLQTAKDLCRGGCRIRVDELCDPALIGDELFRLIISAFVICRYGLSPQNL